MSATVKEFYLGYLIGQLKSIGVDSSKVFEALKNNDYGEAMKISYQLEKEQYGKTKDPDQLMNLFRLFRKVICLGIIPNPEEVTKEVDALIASKAENN